MRQWEDLAMGDRVTPVSSWGARPTPYPAWGCLPSQRENWLGRRLGRRLPPRGRAMATAPCWESELERACLAGTLSHPPNSHRSFQTPPEARTSKFHRPHPSAASFGCELHSAWACDPEPRNSSLFTRSVAKNHWKDEAQMGAHPDRPMANNLWTRPASVSPGSWHSRHLPRQNPE